MNVEAFCRQLESQLAPLEGDMRLESVAQALSEAFEVSLDEVALFSLDSGRAVLRFCWPLKLKKLGFLPLSSNDSLAARTLRDNQAFLNNNFLNAPHAAIFERVRLDDGGGERPQPIHKILSVPIPSRDGARGVIQISRKAPRASTGVQDFSESDLASLVEIATTIGRYL